jgi:cytochrome c
MKDCAPEPKVASFLPEFARNAHGNLAEQNRMVGAQHGADTTRPELKAGEAPVSVALPKANAVNPETKAVLGLMQKYICTACHGIDKKIVGPAFTDVAKKYPGQVDYITKKIQSGGTGIWGAVLMPPQTLPEAEARQIATWIAAGATK